MWEGCIGHNWQGSDGGRAAGLSVTCGEATGEQKKGRGFTEGKERFP